MMLMNDMGQWCLHRWRQENA